MNCSIWWWLQENNKFVFDNYSSDRAQLCRHEFIITLDLCTMNNYISIVLGHQERIAFTSALIDAWSVDEMERIENITEKKAFCSDKRPICLLVATLENSFGIDL